MRARRPALGTVGAAVVALALFTWVRPAAAHDVRPGVLALKELSPGRFAVHWSPPTDGTPALEGTKPRFPDQCQVETGHLESDSILDCGPKGLAGAIQFERAAMLARVSVDIQWFHGPRELRVASGDPAVLLVSGVPQGAPLAQQIELARSYVAMGVEHILYGIDHLMFVMGLLLFVGSMRRLLATITAFTVAHSVTLAASALDVVRLPSPPVEVCIALSILLLAVEATRKEPTWTHRWPWLVAFAFGLLHGFGFASALAEVGLPPQHSPLALASFNVGVELGQLAAVAVVAFAWRALIRGAQIGAWATASAITVLGGSSVYWCLDRALALWRAGG